MKKIIIILLFLLPVAYCLPPAFALESSHSADIKAKLEELKKAIASRAAKLKQEVNRKLQNKAYIGKVKSKSINTLTLDTRNGLKTVSINQDTVFESKIKSKKLSSNTISEENYIAGLGDVDETGVLTAKKIVLLPTPNSQPKTFLGGQIMAISDKLVTLKGKNSKNVALSLPNSSGVKTLDFVILTGIKGKNDIFEADFVYAKPKPASRSASPSGLPRTF